jgi:hypothetical protein
VTPVAACHGWGNRRVLRESSPVADAGSSAGSCAPAAPQRSASADELGLGGIRALRWLPAALGETVTSSAAPYGYTLTVWASGAVLIRSHGTPSVGEVFLFVAGAEIRGWVRWLAGPLVATLAYLLAAALQLAPVGRRPPI